MKRKLLSSVLSLIILINLNAQEPHIESNDSTKNFNIKVLPIIYYLPETSLAFGLAGVSTFRISSKQKRASVFQFASDYTLKKQLILTSVFDIFSNNENYRLIGEISYFNYYYNFYGIGINTKKEDFEKYKTKFPRIRLNLYRELKGDFKIGLLYQFEGINKIEYKDEGLLSSNNYVGKDGGTVANLGLGLLFDTRDNIISAYKGFFGEVQFHHSSSFLSSKFKYEKASIDLRYYTHVSDKVVLASNMYSANIFGDAPFYDMYMFGSNNKGRGVNDRRYRDKAFFITQAELRIPIKGRFRVNLFGSIATVNDRLDHIFNDSLVPSYGLGLRYQLNKNERSMLRADLGHSKDGLVFYLTTGEAF